jgi:hypothetical protein
MMDEWLRLHPIGGLVAGLSVGTVFWWIVIPRMLHAPKILCPFTREWWYFGVYLRWKLWRISRRRNRTGEG